MAEIIAHIRALVQQRSLNETSRQVVDHFQITGEKASKAFAQGYEKENVKVLRALDQVAEKTSAVARKDMELAKVQRERMRTEFETMLLGEKISAQRKRQERELKVIGALEKNLAEARRRSISTAKVADRMESERKKMRAEHIKHAKELRDLELDIQQITLNGSKEQRKLLPAMKDRRIQLSRRDAEEIKDLRDSELALQRVRQHGTRIDDEVAFFQKEINDRRKDADSINKDLVKSEGDLEKSKRTTLETDEKILRLQEDLESASRKRILAQKMLADVDTKQMGTLERTFHNINRIGAATRWTLRGLGTLAAPPAILLLIDTLGVLKTSTQALWLLPAAAGAAAAGIGTLALGLQGFGDVIKNIRDPEKFAEAIQSLAPNAQQAALSIRNLLPEFDKLKNVTQDTLFANVGERIHQMFSTFAPTIESTTTGIAGAFNQMFHELGIQLMRPETQDAIRSFADNTVQAFQNLAPAIGPFIDGLARLMDVGSGFLPELATGLANAANSFANFIREAQASGDLEKWIREGITAVGNLAEGIWDLGRVIFNMFSDNEEGLSSFSDTIGMISGTLALLSGDFSILEREVIEDMQGMTDAGQKFMNFIVDIPEILATAARKTVDGLNEIISFFTRFTKQVIDTVIREINRVIDGINWVIPDWLPGWMGGGDGIPKIPEIAGDWDVAPIPQVPESWGGDWGEFTLPETKKDRKESGLGRRDGLYPDYPGPFDTPAPPGGKGPSAKERRDALYASLDPAEFAVDPFAPIDPNTLGLGPIPGMAMPAMPGVGPGMAIPGLPGAGPGMAIPGQPGGAVGEVDPRAVVRNQIRVQREAFDVQEARKWLAVLQKDNLSTEKELLEAEQKLKEETWQFFEAQWDLADALQGKVKKTKRGLTEGLLSLDDDLGLSRGLGGLVENLVKAVGMALTAPTMNSLAPAAAEANGASGLLGMWGERNVAAGLSPIGLPLAGGGTPTTLGGMATSALRGGTVVGSAPAGGQPTGGNVGAMLALAQAVSGKAKYAPASDLINGLADCSGAISDLYEVLTTGRATPERMFTTVNFASDAEAAKLGFLPGYKPGALNVGVNPYPGQSGHMAATLPNGVNFESGGATGTGGLYGGKAAGALDPQFEKQYHLPLGLDGMAFGGMASLGGSSIPVPLPVIIVGGSAGGSSPGGVLGRAMGGSVADLYSPANTDPGLTPGANWEAIAQKESGGRWDLNTGNGLFGGLQFKQSSWEEAGGLQYAPSADRATKEQQIAVAEQLLRKQGKNAWPNTFVGPGESRGTGVNPIVSPDSFKLNTGAKGGDGVSLDNFLDAVSGKGKPSDVNIGSIKFGGVEIGAGTGISAMQAGLGLKPFAPPPGNAPPGGVGPFPVPQPVGPVPPPSTPGPFHVSQPSGQPAGTVGPFAVPPAVADAAAAMPQPPRVPIPWGGGATMPATPGTPPGGQPHVGSGSPAGPPQYGTGEVQGGFQPAGGGFSGLGGAPMSALQAGASAAADAFAPGSGAAAQMAMQLINRTIGYGGQVAGIAVDGLMETFSVGDTALGDLGNSWLGKLAAGFAGAGAAFPNTAGNTELPMQQQQQGDRRQQIQQAGQQLQQGPTVQIDKFVQAEGRNGQQTANDLAFKMHAQGGR